MPRYKLGGLEREQQKILRKMTRKAAGGGEEACDGEVRALLSCLVKNKYDESSCRAEQLSLTECAEAGRLVNPKMAAKQLRTQIRQRIVTQLAKRRLGR